jgi:hypothetical protein
MLNFSQPGVTSSRHDGHDVINQMEVVMNTHIDTVSEDLIDLGNASAETMGTYGVGPDLQNQKIPAPGLVED